jgi:cell division septation protein DedD
MASRAASDTPQRGKQIVFLFMAATVVSVVVFLCGVLVGRGTPAADQSSGPTDGFSIYELPPATLTTPSTNPSAGAAVSDDLTYPQRLLGTLSTANTTGAGEKAEGALAARSPSPSVAGNADEVGSGPDTDPDFGVGVALDPDSDIDSSAGAGTLNVSDRERPGRDATRNRRSSSPSETRDTSRTSTRVTESQIPRQGYAVQVSASRGASSAEAVALQLRSKGFPAFVLDPFPDDPVRFHRVRVGPYHTRAEADRARELLTTGEGMSAAYITR